MTKETDWEERYQQEDTPWDKGQPAPGLIDWLNKQKLAPEARVLVPGCGRGHDASAWAKAGFETTGVDFSDLALSDARQIRIHAQPCLFSRGFFERKATGTLRPNF